MKSKVILNSIQPKYDNVAIMIAILFIVAIIHKFVIMNFVAIIFNDLNFMTVFNK